MSDLKIAMAIDADNPNVGDIYLENGTVRLTKSLLEEVAQRIRVSLLMFKGEWFLDDTQGIPYWQNILGQRTPLSQVQRIFRNAIQGQPGVKMITAFSVVRIANRQLDIRFACKLDDGAILNSSDFAPFVVGV